MAGACWSLRWFWCNKNVQYFDVCALHAYIFGSYPAWLLATTKAIPEGPCASALRSGLTQKAKCDAQTSKRRNSYGKLQLFGNFVAHPRCMVDVFWSYIDALCMSCRDHNLQMAELKMIPAQKVGASTWWRSFWIIAGSPSQLTLRGRFPVCVLLNSASLSQESCLFPRHITCMLLYLRTSIVCNGLCLVMVSYFGPAMWLSMKRW